MQHSFIWKHGEESLETFHTKLNSFHPTIKLTAGTIPYSQAVRLNIIFSGKKSSDKRCIDLERW